MDRLVSLSPANVRAIGACLDVVANEPLLLNAVPELHRESIRKTLQLFEQLHAENTIIQGD